MGKKKGTSGKRSGKGGQGQVNSGKSTDAPVEEKCEGNGKKLKRKEYEAHLRRLQIELVKLHEWIKQEGLKVVGIFEGRDAKILLSISIC